MAMWLDLSTTETLIIGIITVLAGIIRGFAGFALSAFVMATAVLILPPLELIPMLWWMEMVASLLMMKGGFADADRPTAYVLVIGSAVGWPLGLWLTTTLPIETSKIVALTIIVTLASTQLAKLRLGFLATRRGLYITGIVSGVVSGLANVGGMVVALYVLASDAPARQMRGSLVLYLLLGAVMSLIIQLSFGVMNRTGVLRGMFFAIPIAAGVVIGQRLFTPRFEPYYRPICLTLLITFASIGLIRTIII